MSFNGISREVKTLKIIHQRWVGQQPAWNAVEYIPRVAKHPRHHTTQLDLIKTQAKQEGSNEQPAAFL